MTDILDEMFADLAVQDPLYRPTSFWTKASQEIRQQLEDEGVNAFRRLPMALSYFVPTYRTAPALTRLVTDALAMADVERKQRLTFDDMLCGRAAASADHRVLLAGDNPATPPALHHFSESTFGQPVEQFEFNGRRFSRSSLNYLLGLSFLKRFTAGERIETVLEIGGGFGTLGEIFASVPGNRPRYIDLDIPPVAFVAQSYLQHLLSPDSVSTYATTRDKTAIEITELRQTSVLCSWQIEHLRGTVDLFVNFISFQEMEPDVVANYLGHVRRLGTRWVLLRNLREGKPQRSDGAVGVDTPILGTDYAKMLPGYELLGTDDNCFGHTTVDGFHSELQVYRRSE